MAVAAKRHVLPHKHHRSGYRVPDNPLAVEAWGKPQDIDQMVRSFPES
jgi:hypothetical protein